jgi:hypothetical protein
MVRDVSDNQGNSFDEFPASGGEVVIDEYIVARREEFSHGVRSDVSSASGHQYLHLVILLNPVTVKSRGCSRGL